MAGPSESLLQMLNNCSQDVKPLIESKVKQLYELFCANYNNNANAATNDNSKLDFEKKHLLMALFYKLLEMILNDEKCKNPNYDMTNLLLNEQFIQCLFACCLEIVIYSYKSNDKIFPWILYALNLDAYYFYKVIEIIVRTEDQLSREVVKHLNQIEENILESLVWQNDSPLWQIIESLTDGVPSCEEVSLPETLETVDPNIPGQSVLRQVALDRDAHHDVQSPISSASERFQSPVAVSQYRRPMRTGSVALFFRKFYNLACVRMQDLCNSFKISGEEDKKKIWTIFEYSIKERTKLMKDRHLNHILICAIYIRCKLVKMEKNLLAEIVRTSQNFHGETCGHFLKFYTTVYVPEVKEFANRFDSTRGSVMNLLLSPLPKGKSPANSPANSPVRRVTSSIVTRTLNPKAISASPAPQLSYCFSTLFHSPTKDLEAINKMMISVDARKGIRKRLLSDDTDIEMTEATSPTKKTTTYVARKLENIIRDRQTQSQ